MRDSYRDPRQTPAERTTDLLGRLSLEEKVGLMFHTVIESGPGGSLVETTGSLSKSPTRTVVRDKHMNHFNVHGLGTPREAARWANALQRLAAETEHGIPVTVSTDPRHAFTENAGASFAARGFSQWPEPLGLAALDDADIREHAQIARREYLAVGIRMALHPQVDLASEPRWGRQFQTFGADAERTTRALVAYLEGFQGPDLGPDSVACVTKHFPGGGPQQDGEDAHFPYGREQVYPGGGFALHLAPFRAAIAAGTAGMMPYYGMPIGLELDGEPVEEVGFGYNRAIITGLLRERLGFDGVVVTDWELIHDNVAQGQVLPAKAWGVEHLSPAERLITVIDAGCDQFGGEECTDLLVDLVRTGHITEGRIDVSARRLLELKFRLGLFDDPYVDEDAAERIVGSPAHSDAGFRAQAASVTVLRDEGPLLPLRPNEGRRVYVEGMSAAAAAELGTVVGRAEDADLAIVRLPTPFEPRDDLLFESLFHQGSLEYRPGLVARLRGIAAVTTLIVDAGLERPAILTPILPLATVLVGTYGTSDAALVAALTGRIRPRGRLPFEIPRSMDAVRVSHEDIPNDTADPLFPAGFRWSGASE
ncbi:glycoside hydrolase family 3 protein [Microbacterium sp. cx-55]|uniref:glycoside hydrolase family 3 protein n=1 Tax=Microbacterium sp. cx-55 TaxID=2875948 RepID=UPI001CBC840A|nr:glycoside hydrolase family 3 N-terminal domain-containing protein [Microbacterium sp. cx-55]MBZ4487487.1 glycoside hydrolase family 3 protein [Microbacterium sp. cx-55]UGB35507.1 glycoside hydrolase family 3 protein [Microbacterium sp. cx-55]